MPHTPSFADRLKRLITQPLSRLLRPRMIYGWRRADGVFLPRTRLSTTTVVQGGAHLHIEDDVFVWHFTILDATAGLHIERGCQIGSYVSVLSHSTHIAIRLNGANYYGQQEPPGYKKAATRIGAYTFVGPHSVISAGADIGKGVLVKAYSLVVGKVPDFAIVEGNPARVVGDTRDLDRSWLQRHPQVQADYEAWAGSSWRERKPPQA